MAKEMFKFVLVESGQTTYDNLAVKDKNTMYAVTETNRIYFDGNLVADKNVFVSEAIPTEAGKEGMVYVVTGETGRGIYKYDTTASAYTSIVSFADFVTEDGEQTLTNKTISATNNTITDITTESLATDAMSTAIADAETAVDTKLATEKAVRTELDTKVDKVEGYSLVSDEEIERLSKVDNYTHPDIAAAVEAGTAYNKVTFDATGHVATASAETTIAGLGITDVYTKTEVDTAISGVIQGLDWKEAVDTFEDIATTYTEPEEGWTVSVKDTNNVYRYDEETASWINVFTAETNIVEASVDGVGGHAGLMSAAQAEKLAGIAAGGEVNQNAVSSIVTDEGTVTADSKTDSISIVGGKDISVKAEGKTITVESTYAHPTIASGVTAGTAYNKVTFDETGHIASATAETTMEGLGVTGTSEDITAMTGYAVATEKADIAETDSLNAAIGKLEYRINNQATELEGVLNNKVDKTQIATTLSSESTDTEIASAKAVYDALTVVRL